MKSSSFLAMWTYKDKAGIVNHSHETTKTNNALATLSVAHKKTKMD